MSNLDRILSSLQGVRRSGNGWKARCPAHDDQHPSLSIKVGSDGRVLLHCFVGCDTEQIVQRLGLRMTDLFERDQPPGRKEPSYPPLDGATVQLCRGCTLEQYAEEKRIPIDFLRSVGLANTHYQGVPGVRLPYFDRSGAVISTRYRIANSGEKFRWKSGDKTYLYGQSRHAEVAAAGYVVLVEGESDCHTLWHAGIPAVGIPGANTWKEERNAAFFDGIETIYVVIEPDGGGEKVLEWLARSVIRDRVKLIDCGDHKDPSGLYLATGDDFLDAWKQVTDRSRTWADVFADAERLRTNEAWKACQHLAEIPDLLSLAAETVAERGLTGESRAVKLLFLILISRLFERPVSAAIKGPSSAGKSYLVEKVLELFPDPSYYALSAMSERALAYSEEPLSHRFLVIYEAAGLTGDFASYLVRSLLSEGRLRYETVEKTREGMKPRLIERLGPTGLIVTTTAVRLHPENETRLISIPVSDSPDQTAKIMDALAQSVMLGSDSQKRPDVIDWHALQIWLEGGERRVSVPFARELSESILPVAVRLRRDFGLLLTLIRAHALLHRATRQLDKDGFILATLEDYDAVRELVASLIADGIDATVTPVVRETVQTTSQLLKDQQSGDGEAATISLSQLARELKLDKSVVSRRVKVAIEREFLVNHETRRGKPMRLSIGEPMPDETDVLPSVKALAERCSVAVLPEGITTPDCAVVTEVGEPIEVRIESIGPESWWPICSNCGRQKRYEFSRCPHCEQVQADLEGTDNRVFSPLSYQ